MNCGSCGKALDVDCYLDEEYSRPRESIDNGARCLGYCDAPTCDDCLKGGDWCPDCRARDFRHDVRGIYEVIRARNPRARAVDAIEIARLVHGSGISLRMPV